MRRPSAASCALVRPGAALFAVAGLHMLYLVLQSQSMAATARAEAARVETSVAFYRADLARHLYLVTGPRPRTRFFLMILAAVLMLIGIARSPPDLNPWFHYGLMALCVASLVAGLAGARKRVRSWRRQIAELDALPS